MQNLQPPPPYNNGSNELVSLHSTRSDNGNFASRSASTNLPSAHDTVAQSVTPNTVINLTNSSDVVIG